MTNPNSDYPNGAKLVEAIGATLQLPSHYALTKAHVQQAGQPRQNGKAAQTEHGGSGSDVPLQFHNSKVQ